MIVVTVTDNSYRVTIIVVTRLLTISCVDSGTCPWKLSAKEMKSTKVQTLGAI